VVAGAEPVEVVGIDPAEGFLRVARERVQDPRASFRVADAMAIPVGDNGFDAVVSGLVLNFVPEPQWAVGEFERVAAPGATIAAYVWDYAGGMDILRYFWEAAVALDPAAATLNEGVRFSLCLPDPLRQLWTGAGLSGVEVRDIELPARFVDFDDYWRPFLGGQGPAAGYAMSLPEQARVVLREELRARVPQQADGSLELSVKAWAVRGKA
jgi:SAM-dependent methyltransferase